MLLRRESTCAPHTDSSYGSTFDSKGNPCLTMSDEERTTLAVGLALCAVLLIIVCAVWGAKWIRAKIKAKRPPDENTMYKAPLITSAFSSRPTSGIRTPSPEIASPSKAAQLQPPLRRSSVMTPAGQVMTSPNHVMTSPISPIQGIPPSQVMIPTNQVTSPTVISPTRQVISPTSQVMSPTSQVMTSPSHIMNSTPTRATPSSPIDPPPRFHLPVLSAQGDMIPPTAVAPRPVRGASLPSAATNQHLPSPPPASPGRPLTPTTPTMHSGFSKPQPLYNTERDKSSAPAWNTSANGFFGEPQRYSPVPGYSPGATETQPRFFANASSSDEGSSFGHR